MTRYTEKDVEELVYGVQYALKNTNGPIAGSSDLKRQLAPFLPDPEEALIEKMCRAFDHGYSPIHGNMLRDAMSAVLAVVKQEGLP